MTVTLLVALGIAAAQGCQGSAQGASVKRGHAAPRTPGVPDAHGPVEHEYEHAGPGTGTGAGADRGR